MCSKTAYIFIQFLKLKCCEKCNVKWYLWMYCEYKFLYLHKTTHRHRHKHTQNTHNKWENWTRTMWVRLVADCFICNALKVIYHCLWDKICYRFTSKRKIIITISWLLKQGWQTVCELVNIVRLNLPFKNQLDNRK